MAKQATLFGKSFVKKPFFKNAENSAYYQVVSVLLRIEAEGNQRKGFEKCDDESSKSILHRYMSDHVDVRAKTNKGQESTQFYFPSSVLNWPQTATSRSTKQCSDVDDQGFASPRRTTEAKQCIYKYM